MPEECLDSSNYGKLAIRLILLGTEGCHLCVDAEMLIAEAIRQHALRVDIEKIDISEHEKWQAEYAVRIPVLLHPESRRELAWPFDQNTLNNFLYGLQQ